MRTDRVQVVHINMKLSFTCSIHAIEKHLNHRNVHESVFYNQHMLYKSIKNCLNRPDVVKQYGKRFEHIKRFTYDTGLMGYTDRTSKFVKVARQIRQLLLLPLTL